MTVLQYLALGPWLPGQPPPEEAAREASFINVLLHAGSHSDSFQALGQASRYARAGGGGGLAAESPTIAALYVELDCDKALRVVLMG